MKRILYTLLALAATAAPAVAQTTQRLSAGKATEYGLVYTLPQTALDITLEVELTETKPGEFFNYANRHLGITDAIRREGHSARLLSATIVPRGVPDEQQQWLVQFKTGTSPFMILNAAGVPLAVNTDATAPAPAVSLPVARDAAPTPLETDAARQAVTQDMTRSSSMSKRAELAAQRIFELREMRNDLLSGNADNTPPDGKAMQLVLDNIAAQEAALTAMFAGTTSTRTVVRTISVMPDSDDFSGLVVARISALDGIVDADNLAGAPVSLAMNVTARGELPVTEKGEPKRFPKGGFAYTIPGEATFSLSYNGRSVASATLPMAQLGTVFGIDPNVFTDRKAPSCAILDPTTGGILRLEPVKP
ncbi:MAG: DUF4831 family protein [Muribaculaceae bacterium]|nr:DUF4831 family protein [Muribaculaceae bacterium]